MCFDIVIAAASGWSIEQKIDEVGRSRVWEEGIRRRTRAMVNLWGSMPVTPSIWRICWVLVFPFSLWRIRGVKWRARGFQVSDFEKRTKKPGKARERERERELQTSTLDWIHTLNLHGTYCLFFIYRLKRRLPFWIYSGLRPRISYEKTKTFPLLLLKMDDVMMKNLVFLHLKNCFLDYLTKIKKNSCNKRLTF